MSDKKPSAQVEYHRRRVADGDRRVSVWVPVGKAQEFFDAFDKLQRRWIKNGDMKPPSGWGAERKID